MRPIKLTMQAFGPYREEESVDFTELGPNRVFLIHGDTGAGKTTILDAIVFALYGDTSGGERKAEQMRCESAPDDLATQVVFDFSLGPRSFRVKRRPAQQYLGARGAMVSKAAEVTVWDRSGCSDGHEGKLVATRVNEANNFIKGELGFSCEQFRQVVVLPQGRFRELLAAGSDKREEILRQLFKSARFQRLEDALYERAKVVRKRIDQLKTERDAQLSLVEAADDRELLALTGAAASELAAATTWVADAEASALRADEAREAAEAADQARRAVVAARAELERLEARKEQIEAARYRVAAGARADKVQPAADRLAEAGRLLAAHTTAKAEADEALGQAREAEQGAVEALAAENERFSEREVASEKVRFLQSLTVAIEAWTTAQDEFEGTQTRVDLALRASEEAAEALTEAERGYSILQQRLLAAKTAATQVDMARTRYEGAKLHEDRCKRLLAAHAAVHAAETRYRGLEVAESSAMASVGRAESELAHVEERWRAGRAVALAAALVPGQPCPVCGATDHPAPAGHGGAEVSDDYMAAAKGAAEQARRIHSETRDATARASNDLTAAQTAEQAIREEPGASSELSLPDAEAAVTVCLAQLEELSALAEIGGLEAELPVAEAAATTARSGAKAALDVVFAEEKAVAAAEARRNERAAAAPEELRAPGALATAIHEALAMKKRLDESFAAAQQRMSEAKEKRVGQEGVAAAAATNQANATEHEKTCLAGFAAALVKHTFANEEDWRRSLLGDEERVALETELEAYGNALQQAKGRLHQAESAAKDRPERAGLEESRAAAQAAREAHSAAIARQADARNAVVKLAKVKQTLAEIDASSEEVHRTYDTVGVLSDVAGGNNAGRVSFQRWVLGVYLDEVLIGASRKLFSMSKGRYQLQRQREATSGRRPAGLDLAVFDEFSGTSRPAVTLSGGESFLAALALALGLAETVQEHAAGVPLETIFVDEGFGALDSDALELAIDSLMELQQGGRLVGVISHVPEMRQVIPARLEVHGGLGRKLHQVRGPIAAGG